MLAAISHTNKSKLKSALPWQRWNIIKKHIELFLEDSVYEKTNT